MIRIIPTARNLRSSPSVGHCMSFSFLTCPGNFGSNGLWTTCWEDEATPKRKSCFPICIGRSEIVSRTFRFLVPNTSPANPVSHGSKCIWGCNLLAVQETFESWFDHFNFDAASEDLEICKLTESKRLMSESATLPVATTLMARSLAVSCSVDCQHAHVCLQQWLDNASWKHEQQTNHTPIMFLPWFRHQSPTHTTALNQRHDRDCNEVNFSFKGLQLSNDVHITWNKIVACCIVNCKQETSLSKVQLRTRDDAMFVYQKFRATNQQRLSCRFGLLVWVFLINLYFDQRKKRKTLINLKKKLINLKNHQRNVQTY